MKCTVRSCQKTHVAEQHSSQGSTRMQLPELDRDEAAVVYQLRRL